MTKVSNPTVLRLLVLPPEFVSITVDSNGNFLAMIEGDCGYNAFLGKPSIRREGPGFEHRRRVWESLSPLEQAKALNDWKRLGLSPEDVA